MFEFDLSHWEEKSLKRIPWIASCVAMLVLAGSVYPAAAAVLRGTKQQPVAVIETSMGNMTCVLFPKSAPIGTANFIGLARGTKDWTDPRSGKKMHGVPLYDNTTFHRVIPQFMIQAGDPLGNGMGTPGYQFKNETWPTLKFDQPGRLAYANAGPDTNGSQFFITEVPTPFLDGKYTIFGQCDAPSVRLVKKIARVARDASDKPNTPVVIQHIEIDDGSRTGASVRGHRR
jgi:peptidyl-prolyl cis-trans isomerase A (cyclophilin A)